MKAYGAMEVHLHSFLTFALDAGERSASPPATLLPRKKSPLLTEDKRWISPRYGLYILEKKKNLDDSGLLGCYVMQQCY
jgi:hypothetical protein